MRFLSFRLSNKEIWKTFLLTGNYFLQFLLVIVFDTLLSPVRVNAQKHRAKGGHSQNFNLPSFLVDKFKKKRKYFILSDFATSYNLHVLKIALDLF